MHLQARPEKITKNVKEFMIHDVLDTRSISMFVSVVLTLFASDFINHYAVNNIILFLFLVEQKSVKAEVCSVCFCILNPTNQHISQHSEITLAYNKNAAFVF